MALFSADEAWVVHFTCQDPYHQKSLILKKKADPTIVQLHKDLSTVDGLTLGQVNKFVRLAGQLKDDIILTQPANISPLFPPQYLPPTVVSFLCAGCNLSVNDVELLWRSLGTTIWHSVPSDSDVSRPRIHIFKPSRSTVNVHDARQ
jgi:hypothetical protein